MWSKQLSHEEQLVQEILAEEFTPTLIKNYDDFGNILSFTILAEKDYNTCPNCRVCVPRGQVCPCVMRTLGPCAENTTRKELTKEQKWVSIENTAESQPNTEISQTTSQ